LGVEIEVHSILGFVDNEASKNTKANLSFIEVGRGWTLLVFDQVPKTLFPSCPKAADHGAPALGL